ncbi:hypothetical protein AMC78_CH03164 [Rhizobium phaseoli]|uniref:hypothetical protein n=1 Tax=Rhizobium phaseoli TaxID=396 RepID=UPI0007EBCEA5|nr:hypothetical protein [Rhizobium phaseoli]ANM05233.1 hypothetical protein AMC78_CH03164 [Rhizobium phaseoli]
MRSFYSIRSIGIGSAVIIASLFSLFLVTAPASAEVVPLDAGIYLKVKMPSSDFAFVVFDVLPVAEVGRIVANADVPLMASTALHPLKPEYAESYQTHGLNFVDVRRRC